MSILKDSAQSENLKCQKHGDMSTLLESFYDSFVDFQGSMLSSA